MCLCVERRVQYKQKSTFPTFEIKSFKILMHLSQLNSLLLLICKYAAEIKNEVM